jgi:SAM-dependent methyltransferase
MSKNSFKQYLSRKARANKSNEDSLETEARQWSEQHTHNAHQPDTTYQQYIYAQVKKSLNTARKAQDKKGSRPFARTEKLVGEMAKFLPETGRDKFTVLCVGCRSHIELDYIENACGVKTVGVDLFSNDPRIRVGDMHNLPFDDQSFDALYSCHSLEHAYDVRQALREFVRVTKHGGLLVIEVPVNYDVTEVDRNDFKSTRGLLDTLGEAVLKVLYQKDDQRRARLIVTTRDSSAT